MRLPLPHIPPCIYLFQQERIPWPKFHQVRKNEDSKYRTHLFAANLDASDWGKRTLLKQYASPMGRAVEHPPIELNSYPVLDNVDMLKKIAIGADTPQKILPPLSRNPVEKMSRRGIGNHTDQPCNNHWINCIIIMDILSFSSLPYL